jgi:thioredoxin-related protein
MKFIKIFLPCLIFNLNANAQGIQFQQNTTWNQIKSKAQAENKYILLDAFTTWCVPCREMSLKTFTNENVGNTINEKFVSIKVQMDQTANDNDIIKNWYSFAREVDSLYKITAYPTILYFSSEGNLVFRSVGFRNADDLVKESLNAINKYNDFRNKYEIYKAGRKDSAFVFDLIKKANQSEQKKTAYNIAQEYINSLSPNEVFEKDNLLLLQQYTNSSMDRGFNICRTESRKVNNVLGDQAAERIVRKVIIIEEIKPFIANNKTVDWDKVENQLKQKKYGLLGDEGYFGELMIYSLMHNDTLNFGKYYVLYFKTAFRRADYHINNITMSILEHVDDRKVLFAAIKTQKYNIIHLTKDDPYDIDTYANLLYKVGKTKKALKWERKARMFENKNASSEKRQPNPAFEQTIDKMIKGEKTW